MPRGFMDFEGTVTITYNPHRGDRLIVGEGLHIIPCALCGAPEIVQMLTIAIVCTMCVSRRDSEEITQLEIDPMNMSAYPGV